MEIRFYSNFTKRRNSTRRVDVTGGTAYTCRLKEKTSIFNPTVILQLDNANSTWPNYTLAYITDWGKYYFVKDAVSDGRFWEIALEEDVLATFKYVIGDETLYVTRSSYAFNADIPDTFYPLTTISTVETVTSNTPWNNTAETISTGGIKIRAGGYPASGCFVLGIVTPPVTGYTGAATYGSVTYYVADTSALIAIVKALLTNSSIVSAGISIDGVSNGALKNLIQPTSYIKTCYWLPLQSSSLDVTSQLSSLDIWGFTISFDTSSEHLYYLVKDPPYFRATVTAAISKHPQTTARGNWVNTTPGTRLFLQFPPFGTFELDTTTTANATNLYYNVIIDVLNGAGTLRVNVDSADGNCILETKTQIGVPIQLSEVSYDYVGTTQGVISTISSTISGLISGDILQPLSDAVGTAANAITPHQYTTGSTGSFSDLYGHAKLYHIFTTYVPDNNVRNGRPLCELKKPSAIPGYIKCARGDIAIDATEPEKLAITNFLEGGFYYE